MSRRVVLVTGANGGLGTFVTKAFLAQQATVVGVSRNIKQSDFDSPNFRALTGDSSTEQGAQAIIDYVLQHVGGLNVLAHTVGGFAGGKSLVETDAATLQSMLDLNLNSVFHMLRAALPYLLKSESGRIIAIGSRAALEPGANVGAYSASKAAMVSLIKTVAIENKNTRLTAYVILPGTMDTPANRAAMPKADFSKWVKPSSVASLVAWLAGDEARDVNGAVITIYGSEI